MYIYMMLLLVHLIDRNRDAFKSLKKLLAEKLNVTLNYYIFKKKLTVKIIANF